MSEAWTVVLAVGAATIALKAVGPVALGGRPLPRRLASVVGLLAPAVLAALVVTQVVGGERELVVDERLAGVAAGAVALAARVPTVLVVTVAAVVTALARSL